MMKNINKSVRPLFDILCGPKQFTNLSLTLSSNF